MLGDQPIVKEKKKKKKQEEEEEDEEDPMQEIDESSAPTVSAKGVLFRVVATDEYDDMRILYNALLTEYGAGADRFWEALIAMVGAGQVLGSIDCHGRCRSGFGKR